MSTRPPVCRRRHCAILFVGALSLPWTAAGAQEDLPVPIDLAEATIADLHAVMQSGLLTAEGLCARYLARAQAYDQTGPFLNAILALNPDLLAEARQRDQEAALTGRRGPLFGIPVLLKDNIDALPMPTTAGSLALANSLPPDDAFLASRLRAAGAVVFGKATMTEMANFMTTGMPSGYSARAGHGVNPYDPRRNANGSAVVTPGGSSSGSGIAASANLAAVAIGSETSGSILSPGSQNGVVGLKPTLGLISRDGILPITADQDTAGPIARTVTDVARVLSVIAGHDPNDPATAACLQPGNWFADYTQFLDATALSGARIAVPPPPFTPTADQRRIVQNAIGTLRASGAVVVDPHPPLNLGFLGGIATTQPPFSGQSTVLIFGMKRDLNRYLQSLGPAAPRQSLADIIAFNNLNAATAQRYGQSILLACDRYDATPGSADETRYLADRSNDLTVSRAALDAVYAGPDGQRGTTDDFDAILFPANFGADAPARAGYPSIVVPGGLLTTGVPFGITFSGPAFSEPRLLALAFAFEQATGHRTPPASAPPLPTDRIPLGLPGVRVFGTGCSGSRGVPTITAQGPLVLGSSTVAIALGSLPAGAPTLVGLSLRNVSTRFGSCFVYPALPFDHAVLGTSDGSGAARLQLPIPWAPSVVGVHVFAQGGAIDASSPAGLALTVALDITVGG
jgi:amidase